jgi:hypothetical protein
MSDEIAAQVADNKGTGKMNRFATPSDQPLKGPRFGRA